LGRFLAATSRGEILPWLEKMNATTEGPDDWRKREIQFLIVRLLLGLIQIIGAMTSIWLMVATGLSWLSCSVIVITLFFALLSRIRLSRR